MVGAASWRMRSASSGGEHQKQHHMDTHLCICCSIVLECISTYLPMVHMFLGVIYKFPYVHVGRYVVNPSTNLTAHVGTCLPCQWRLKLPSVRELAGYKALSSQLR